MNNQNNLELNWGIVTPVVYNDPKYGQVELLFKGVCNYTLVNPNVNSEQITNSLNSEISFAINQIVQSSNVDYKLVFAKVNDTLYSTFSNLHQNDLFVVNNIDVTHALLSDISKQRVNELKMTAVTVVQTDTGAKDGQNKCPKCGATDISLNVNTGKLRCNFCRCEFEAEKVSGLDGDISQLQGQVMGSGATDIIADTKDVLTFKCSSCGAEVVVDTATSAQARCHWCRNTLSVNQQIPNGSIPDVVLPFAVKKDEAKAEIEKFVGKRKFFAHPKFSREFSTDNIMGVYFPYMLVDVNSHVSFAGQGEKLVRTYTVGSGDSKKTYYDADLYEVTRDFDLTIDDLTVESSADKLNGNQKNKTTNIINAIMPFDTENCVKWNANYIKGYTSEKRDTNVDQLRSLVEAQSRDIARFSANQTLKEYNRGVAWSSEQFMIKGQQWKAAYLPVWLYSYYEMKGEKQMLHYVAVNARTKETMGSVPLHIPKLILFSFLVEILGFIAMLFTADFEYNFIFLLLGFIFFIVMYLRYRNSNARHKHESESKSNMSSVTGTDRYIKRLKGLRNSRMQGANNKNVNGATAGGGVLNAFSKDNIVNTIADNNSVTKIIKNNIINK